MGVPASQGEPPVHVDVHHVDGGSLALAGGERVIDAGLLGREAGGGAGSQAGSENGQPGNGRGRPRSRFAQASLEGRS